MTSSAAVSRTGKAASNWPLLAFGVAFACALVLLFAPDGAQLAYGEGVALIGVCLLPLIAWQRSRARGLPMFELICLSYAVQYAIPLYIEPNQLVVNSRTAVMPWAGTAQSLSLVILGVAAMIAAWVLVSRMLSGVPRIDLVLPLAARARYIGWALSVGIIAIALTDLNMGPGQNSSMAALIHVAADQTFVAIALLGMGVYRRELSGVWTTVLYGTVALSALLGLASGLLENALIPIVVLAIVYWRSTGRVPVRPLLAGVVLFVLLDSVKGAYRSEVWYGSQTPGLTARIDAWLPLTGTEIGAMLADPGTQGGHMIGTAGARLDLLHTFVYVHEATPALIPYFGGQTYSYLAYGWIPRLFWPDKPDAQTNTEAAAVDYGLLARNSGTSIGLGQPAEAYANFGIAGIVVVLALEGAFFAALGYLLNGPNSRGAAAIYLAVMVFFLNGIGSHTATLFGNVIQDVVVMAAVMAIARGNVRLPGAASAVSPRHVRARRQQAL